jgi:hypothetical protein
MSRKNLLVQQKNPPQIPSRRMVRQGLVNRRKDFLSGTKTAPNGHDVRCVHMLKKKPPRSGGAGGKQGNWAQLTKGPWLGQKPQFMQKRILI